MNLFQMQQHIAAARAADPFTYDPFTYNPFTPFAAPPPAPATLNCGNCGSATNLSYVPNCGDVLDCQWCGARYVAHPCQHSQSTLQTIALELLVNGITKKCPQCGVWYKVGEFVERFDPPAGRAIEGVAIAVGLATIIVGLFAGRR
jgi:hypothetical protein